jgi:hypothetical protein
VTSREYFVNIWYQVKRMALEGDGVRHLIWQHPLLAQEQLGYGRRPLTFGWVDSNLAALEAATKCFRY